ncbi:MAG: hypothetical protein BWX47_02128 [candidate division Hyd24-12 bacterium ADurb.Bin004]|nr:MAG: hypothetical protein BWX47_02128 [candidate division Hyd24-12 bacterium ADurb.Bin004]
MESTKLVETTAAPAHIVPDRTASTKISQIVPGPAATQSIGLIAPSMIANAIAFLLPHLSMNLPQTLREIIAATVLSVP